MYRGSRFAETAEMQYSVAAALFLRLVVPSVLGAAAIFGYGLGSDVTASSSCISTISTPMVSTSTMISTHNGFSSDLHDHLKGSKYTCQHVKNHKLILVVSVSGPNKRTDGFESE